MVKGRIQIPDTELKVLFAKSGNLCAFPNCQVPIIAENENQSKPLAEMAHILAYEDNGPRSDPNLPLQERNKASNLILFCPTHHTLVDKFEHQYNVHVLREMKRLHEQKVSRSVQGIKEKKVSHTQSEAVYASLLPISHLPRFVFSATTAFRKNNILELFDFLNIREQRDITYAFELLDKRLYTFSDLHEPDNPFRGAYDQASVEISSAIDLWPQPESHRLYIALLNRGLTNMLKKYGLAYDANHYRYYFRPDRVTVERKFTYRSLAGKRTEKSIVHNPITKATGQPKSYWIHLAANLSFHQIAERQWVLTIRPERHLTKDGYEPYTHYSSGSKITRIKSTMYNWSYLQEIQLWREFISGARPRRVIKFDKEAIVIENHLLKENIEWAGVPDDEKDFVAQEHPEDLFSLAEIDFLDEEEFVDDQYLDEDEE